MNDTLSADRQLRLVDAARDGDRRAFGELVRAYDRAVFSLALRLLGDRLEAEDASQEAFLRAYRALSAFDRARPFSTWLLSITAHHCIDKLRRRRVDQVPLETLPPWRQPASAVEDPHRSAERSDDGARIRQLLQQLSDEQRAVIVLRYYHDFGYEDIAAITGDSVSSVKSRLHRARRRLADLLETTSAGPPRAGWKRHDRVASATSLEGGSACTALTAIT